MYKDYNKTIRPELFEQTVREEILQMLAASNDNPHLVWLAHYFRRYEHINISELTERGLAKVSGEDFLLSDYFFVLSGLDNLSKALENFLTDVMVYCEKPEYFPQFTSKESIL